MVSSDGRPARADVTRRVTRGFSPEALRHARETHPTLHRRGELARVARIGISTLGQWESGLKSPQVDKLRDVVEALGIRMDAVVRIPPGERYLSDWRVLKGMTQPQLGAAAGLSTSTVHRLENGEVALTESSAEALQRGLGIPLEEVIAAYERVRNRPPGTLA
ncbi:helix-turn-helix transcriptional regulator [Nocardia puris]|nr:helix-turn-helix transcriptional regulator [Nocardia puris]